MSAIRSQICRAPRGARLALQVRARLLNDRLAGGFDRRYPRPQPDPVTLTA